MFRLLEERSDGFTIEIDGQPAVAFPGESVAAVLLRQAEPWARTTAISSSRRSPYCMMGVCFDCLLEIDGMRSVQACLATVRQGMVVKRQAGGRE